MKSVQCRSYNILGSPSSPEAFQLLLEHIYAGSFPSEEAAIKCGKELINSANKYDLVELKIADSKCSPLLKVYALSYFVLHHKKVVRVGRFAVRNYYFDGEQW